MPKFEYEVTPFYAYDARNALAFSTKLLNDLNGQGEDDWYLISFSER